MYRHWNLGSVEETLNGEIFTPAGVSSQQAWSGSMVLHPISEGMLGIKPDALSKKITRQHIPILYENTRQGRYARTRHR